MNRIFAMLASTAIIALALTAGHAAAAPLPPRVNFVKAGASQLHLGMTADEVVRVMGRAARETDFAIASIQMRKLEFIDAISGQVILSNDKVSPSRSTHSKWKRMLPPLPSAEPGRGLQAARCDAPSASPQQWFITHFSGSRLISGFTRVPRMATPAFFSGPTA